MKRTSLAGWIFAGPSLIVLGVFFGLPVASALALSVTDFDLYALADSSNLRLSALATTSICCRHRCSGSRCGIPLTSC